MTDECYACGFWDSDYYSCICPTTDKWYACPIEARKPENQKALEDWAKQLAKENTERYENNILQKQKKRKQIYRSA